MGKCCDPGCCNDTLCDRINKYQDRNCYDRYTNGCGSYGYSCQPNNYYGNPCEYQCGGAYPCQSNNNCYGYPSSCQCGNCYGYGANNCYPNTQSIYYKCKCKKISYACKKCKAKYKCQCKCGKKHKKH